MNYTQQLRYNLENLPFKEMMENFDIAEIQHKLDERVEKKIKMRLENQTEMAALEQVYWKNSKTK